MFYSLRLPPTTSCILINSSHYHTGIIAAFSWYSFVSVSFLVCGWLRFFDHVYSSHYMVCARGTAVWSMPFVPGLGRCQLSQYKLRALCPICEVSASCSGMISVPFILVFGRSLLFQSSVGGCHPDRRWVPFVRCQFGSTSYIFVLAFGVCLSSGVWSVPVILV